jgi:hypothetical protein
MEVLPDEGHLDPLQSGKTAHVDTILCSNSSHELHLPKLI